MDKTSKNTSSYEYIVLPVISLLLIAVVLKLWNANLRIPLNYSGDALQYSSWIKGIIENGWWTKNTFLGAPFTQTLYDFPYPATATLQILIIKALGMLTDNTWLTLNLYCLLTFPLITLTSLLCLRNFGISRYTSMVGSLLFAFLPYHFFSDESHLFSSGYYMVPLSIMVFMWIYFEDSQILFIKNHTNSRKLILSNKYLLALIIIILLGISGIHFAFFSAFLLLIAGITGAIARRNLNPFVNAIILVGILSAVVLTSLLPTIIYTKVHGRDHFVANRSPAEADYYGLRIAQLVLPVDGHRLSILNKLKTRYNHDMGLNNYSTFYTFQDYRKIKHQSETSWDSLGAVASAGFFFLIFWVLFGRSVSTRGEFHYELLNALSVLNCSALLLATVGGFGVLFAFFVSPQIRCYNRISVFIAFISLFAVCVLLDLFFKKINDFSKYHKLYVPVVVIVLIVVGIFDQTTPQFVPDYKKIEKMFVRDDRFISRIQAIVPPGAMIFQLPYIFYPENPVIHHILYYEPLIPYLHSKDLRWTFGAMRGREADLWQKQVTAKPTAEFVKDITIAGFSGIYLDRYGYADDGKKLVGEISGIVKASPLESPNKRYVFFPLRDYRQNLLHASTKQQIEKWREEVLHPVQVAWPRGCFGMESDSTHTWRWCSAKAQMVLLNTSKVDRKVKLSMTFFSGHNAPSTLKIASAMVHADITLTAKGTPFAVTLSLPPGSHSIQFSTDAKRVYASPDRRKLYFRIERFELNADSCP